MEEGALRNQWPNAVDMEKTQSISTNTKRGSRLRPHTPEIPSPVPEVESKSACVPCLASALAARRFILSSIAAYSAVRGAGRLAGPYTVRLPRLFAWSGCRCSSPAGASTPFPADRGPGSAAVLAAPTALDGRRDIRLPGSRASCSVRSRLALRSSRSRRTLFTSAGSVMRRSVSCCSSRWNWRGVIGFMRWGKL